MHFGTICWVVGYLKRASQYMSVRLPVFFLVCGCMGLAARVKWIKTISFTVNGEPFTVQLSLNF